VQVANWFYEHGIGEERAILVEQGRIVEARVSRHDGVKAGLIAKARFVKQLIAGKRGIVRLDDGSDLLMSPLPKGTDEGADLMVEVTREAITEHSRAKMPLCRPAPQQPTTDAPSLREQIGSARLCHPHESDYFSEYGWNDVIEEARSGQVSFPGGSLIISLTPAMTVIDVDGELPPLALGTASAAAAAQAIRRLDLQGSIGIDFPGVADKAGRGAIADALDAAMTGPFERTAVNGFGFMQIVKRRSKPSLCEMVQLDRITSYSLELLRMAERDRGTGMLSLAAHPSIIAKLEAQPQWIEELTRRTGRAVSLRIDAKLAIGAYYAE
jgi:hypothetical protein